MRVKILSILFLSTCSTAAPADRFIPTHMGNGRAIRRMGLALPSANPHRAREGAILLI